MGDQVNGTDVNDYATDLTSPRPNSYIGSAQNTIPSRSGTLRKRGSIKRMNSLSRSSSKRRSYAGSVRSLSRGLDADGDGNVNSAFNTPVPTKGTPTELLAERFQEWRRILKDLILYFKEVQKSHESKGKSLEALSRVIQSSSTPEIFMSEGGISEASDILRRYHKQAIAENNRSKQVEEEVVVQLTGLRNDLGSKIKEIKNLSGDFKNTVDKEQEKTREAVRNLLDSVRLDESHPDSATGKADPFLVRLAVERQIEKQINEENYLHQAFLNLENSGRELESIVVGEIQKAYKAYAGILKRDADEQYEVVEALNSGPIALPRTREWEYYIDDNDNFVDPNMPMRDAARIDYPGKEAPAAAEVRAGMLERKSKYLKSYAPGWYVLSPTHLHEFKSQDRLHSQQPVMSLHLSEQRLGAHSNDGSSSHKFVLKGRQSGGMHRGHGWTFRAESWDTMMAWYDDIKSLTEKTGEERNAYVRKHARSLSSASFHQSNTNNIAAAGSISSGDINDDEADSVPYSAARTTSADDTVNNGVGRDVTGGHGTPQGRASGGQIPSDIDLTRHSHMPVGRFSGTFKNNEQPFVPIATATGSATSFPRSLIHGGHGHGRMHTWHQHQQNLQHQRQELDCHISPLTERPRQHSPDGTGDTQRHRHAALSTSIPIEAAAELPGGFDGHELPATSTRKGSMSSETLGPRASRELAEMPSSETAAGYLSGFPRFLSIRNRRK